jgi:hypothetical protein
MGWMAGFLTKSSSRSYRAHHEVIEPPQARAALREALAIAEMLARDGKLNAAQRDLPRRIGEALATLPPEQAEAR